MVDQLRLAAMVVPAGDAPPAPVVPKHERKAFDTLVNYYFPGEEDFIKRGSVVQRPLGTSLHEARVASLRSAKTHYVCSKCENFLCACHTHTHLRDLLGHVWAAQARSGKSSPSSTAGISAKGSSRRTWWTWNLRTPFTSARDTARGLRKGGWPPQTPSAPVATAARLDLHGRLRGR